MKKEVFYQIDSKCYQLVEVETEEQEKIVKELNRNFEKEEKREKRSILRCTSIEELSEQGKELVSRELPPDEKIIQKERHLQLQQAMKTLTPKQITILKLRFDKQMTLNEIAKLMKVHTSTIDESLSSSLKKLKKFLKNF